MSLKITHVRFSGTSKTHQSIVRYKWQNEQTAATGDNDKPSMIDWINKGGQAFVVSGANRAQVLVVNDNPPYLRTKADNTWTDNLLALPTF